MTDIKWYHSLIQNLSLYYPMELHEKRFINKNDFSVFGIWLRLTKILHKIDQSWKSAEILELIKMQLIKTK